MPSVKVVGPLTALALIGSAISIYLTWYTLNTPAGTCSIAIFGNCSLVLSSTYARIAGFPTALLGVGWFLVIVALSLTAAESKNFPLLLFGWALLGMVGVAVLVYVEVILIGSICTLCTSAHLVGVSIAVIAAYLLVTSRRSQTK